MNKKIIILLLCLCVAGGAYFVGEKYFIKTSDPVKYDTTESTTGNSTGNIANSGYVDIHKDSIYGDINPKGLGLYKGNLNLKKLVKISDDQGLYVNADDTWVYYVNYSDNQRLYKVGVDGKNKTKLTNDQVDDLNLEDGWLYYINLSKKGIICKITTNGDKYTVLTKEKLCDNLLVKNGSMYYAIKKDIYKMTTDGSSKSKIANMRNTAYNNTDEWQGNFDVSGGFIYYPGDDGALYCISVDGMKDTKLAVGNVESINVHGNYVYYSSETSKALYRIKLEGKVKIEYVIGGGSYYNINIAGDTGVMYKDKNKINGGVYMVYMNLK